MAIRIQAYPGVIQIFTAAEGIGDLASVELVPGNQVKMGTTGDEHLAAGVSRGAAVSGALVRVVVEGMVSGVKTGLAVQAGDRLILRTSGGVVPLNTIIPSAASGALTLAAIASGALSGVASGLVGILSGVPVIASGALLGIEWKTGRVMGKALTSGASGLGIQMLVSLAG